MKQILVRVLVTIVLCSLFSYAAYRFINIYAMVLSLPLFGIALSRILIDLIAELRHSEQAFSMAHLDGHYFSYLGFTLQVLEDEEHCRWIPTAELRRIVGNVAADRALSLTYPSGWRAFGKPEQGHLRDDALLTYLTKQPSMRAIKFKNWAERNIAFPARRQRERLGIHLSDAAFKDSA